MDPFLPLKNFLMRERPERGDPKTMDMNKLKVRLRIRMYCVICLSNLTCLRKGNYLLLFDFLQ
jgi:hypothetical protein